MDYKNTLVLRKLDQNVIQFETNKPYVVYNSKGESKTIPENTVGGQFELSTHEDIRAKQLDDLQNLVDNGSEYNNFWIEQGSFVKGDVEVPTLTTISNNSMVEAKVAEGIQPVPIVASDISASYIRLEKTVENNQYIGNSELTNTMIETKDSLGITKSEIKDSVIHDKAMIANSQLEAVEAKNTTAIYSSALVAPDTQFYLSNASIYQSVLRVKKAKEKEQQKADELEKKAKVEMLIKETEMENQKIDIPDQGQLLVEQGMLYSLAREEWMAEIGDYNQLSRDEKVELGRTIAKITEPEIGLNM